MKGVIVQIGEPKSIVLFNNGKLAAIPTPADCHTGMVVTVKLNNKLKIIAITFAAVVLMASGVFIGATFLQGRTRNNVAVPGTDTRGYQGGMGMGHGGMMMEHGRMMNYGWQVQTITIQEAKNLPDDTKVTMTGAITQSLGDEKYIFSDPTGEIIVEIDRKLWRNMSVNASNIVEISGEVDVERGEEAVVDVKTLRVR